MVPSYAATLDFLYSLQKHGIKLGLDTIQSLLERAGKPQDRYLILHIGGTNGKGSTAAMVASVLQAAGYRVGLYTSPHLLDFRERIRVNGAPIPEHRVATLTQGLQDAAAGTLSPTFFEFTTAMAFQHFSDSGVEIAVVEVGMGGRFDATNVVRPLVAAITNVSLDHQKYLGESIRAIAFEKAGIIKRDVPVVCGRLSPDAAEVVQEVARNRGAPVYQFGPDFGFEGDTSSGYRYRGQALTREGLCCPLAGDHQLENAACALAMIELAAARGVRVSDPAVRGGLQSLAWEGRLEIAETCPILLLDGAHNPAAAAVVARYLKQFRDEHPGARIVSIIGMMRDKDRDGFLRAILPTVDDVILTEPNLPRAATVRELSESLGGWHGLVHDAPVPADALGLARRLAAAEDLICVTGSLMLVGEVKALLRGCGLSPIRG